MEATVKKIIFAKIRNRMSCFVPVSTEYMESKNYYVIFGRVPTRYVEDRIYGLEYVEQYLKEEK